jgi:hypothetical protein
MALTAWSHTKKPQECAGGPSPQLGSYAILQENGSCSCIKFNKCNVMHFEHYKHCAKFHVWSSLTKPILCTYDHFGIRTNAYVLWIVMCYHMKLSRVTSDSYERRQAGKCSLQQSRSPVQFNLVLSPSAVGRIP